MKHITTFHYVSELGSTGLKIINKNEVIFNKLNTFASVFLLDGGIVAKDVECVILKSPQNILNAKQVHTSV